jgi:carbonic anhydrase
MKLILNSALFLALASKSIDAASGDLYTYYESGGLGPANWANLEIDGNQCGGTNGASGFGQSPVTIDSETVSTCDTDLSAYEFNGGDCTWDDLAFSINNGGECMQYSSTCFPKLSVVQRKTNGRGKTCI